MDDVLSVSDDDDASYEADGSSLSENDAQSMDAGSCRSLDLKAMSLCRNVFMSAMVREQETIGCDRLDSDHDAEHVSMNQPSQI
ncbi:hypothetical protein GOP47_0030567 [Adiantum capillus-veneris]|nr:hypothetical protein GOP47_0030567 [Adiantum capillus-veneris]